MARPVRKKPAGDDANKKAGAPQPVPNQPVPSQPVSKPAQPQPIPATPAAQPQLAPSTPIAAPIPVAKASASPQAVRAKQSMASRARGEDDDADQDELEPDENPVITWCRKHSDWLTSLGVHMIVLIVLGLIVISRPEPEALYLVTVPEDLVEPDDDLDQQAEIDISEMDDLHPEVDLDQPVEAPESIIPEVDHVEEGAPALRTIPDMTALVGPPQTDADSAGSGKGNTGSGAGLGGRGDRRSGAAGFGASKASEDAVELALAWIAGHQMHDGGWNFDHRAGYCEGRCRHHGTGVEARNGATALALLPFMGAGYTHMKGKYKKKVTDGIRFLSGRQQHGANGGSFHEPEGRMYSHGLATLALSEAHGMTQQSSGKRITGLGKSALAGVKFIEYAQHSGGGWRYEPKEAGDTSVVSWQLMALKSAQMAYLPVKPETFKGASRFLDSVQTGSQYGYTHPGQGSATTAIGILARMYMGTPRNDANIIAGVDILSEKGPSDSNLYYDYYATQVLFHFTGGRGERWKKWNEAQRDMLVFSQIKDGHEKGSWHFRGGDDLGVGGRLYYTCMAAMILEVYYRHMPVYKSQLALGDEAAPVDEGEAPAEEEKPEE